MKVYRDLAMLQFVLWFTQIVWIEAQWNATAVDVRNGTNWTNGTNSSFPVMTTPCVLTNKPTPASTVYTSCTKVSVERDATYCITGSICSGSGAQPAGTNCPRKGDQAVESCLSTLPSYVKETCTAPVDAVCKRIKTGAWGCVWDTSSLPSPTPYSSIPSPMPVSTRPASSPTTTTAPSTSTPAIMPTSSSTVPRTTPATTVPATTLPTTTQATTIPSTTVPTTTQATTTPVTTAPVSTSTPVTTTAPATTTAPTTKAPITTAPTITAPAPQPTIAGKTLSETSVSTLANSAENTSSSKNHTPSFIIAIFAVAGIALVAILVVVWKKKQHSGKKSQAMDDLSNTPTLNASSSVIMVTPTNINSSGEGARLNHHL